MDTPNFDKLNGLIPAIIQDQRTGAVLMLGFMNPEAFEKTSREKRVTFFSRTKNRLWTKGEESGHYLNVVEIKPDCDNDTLLIKVIPEGPVCHTGTISCFGDEINPPMNFISELQQILRDRKTNMPESSYTAGLFRKGTNAIAQKLGEEAVELIIESKENNDDRFLNESADLLFHMIILLIERGYGLEDVVEVLKKRH
jgi:phosphoribosyl-ATP pyrophosphohydrolase/phosphoribosyl-AMP cyclohydrolase